VKTIILTLALCFSTALFAREVKLATITGNVDTDTSYFLVEVTEAGDLDSVRYQTVTKEGRVSIDSVFPVQTVIDEGVYLLQRNGRNVLRLETDKTFSVANGGVVKMRYLYSGITNSWKTLSVKMLKGTDDWEIRTMKDEKVSKFFTKGNFQAPFGVIGIAELVPVLR
jgi:hypothetical protein